MGSEDGTMVVGFLGIGTYFSLQLHFNCRSFLYISLGQNQKCFAIAFD